MHPFTGSVSKHCLILPSVSGTMPRLEKQRTFQEVMWMAGAGGGGDCGVNMIQSGTEERCPGLGASLRMWGSAHRQLLTQSDIIS